jgi:ADP-heptose:LPS heptosyltransferase
MTTTENILVIKHSALGDIVLATAAFAAIRRAHPTARIHCLTTSGYASLMAQMPFFDEIWVDSKPRWYDKKGIGHLKAMLNSKPWAWVYDLQTSQRTTLYQWLLKSPWPSISNASNWSSHPRGEYDTAKHALENIRGQLAIAGINDVGMPDVSWLEEDVSELDPALRNVSESLAAGVSGNAAKGESLPSIALLVAGGAAHRPEKRWPTEQYASLAAELVARGITPVLVGTKAEAAALDSIATRVPQAINLCGKTSVAQLATLARAATLAVGNDTGPMHIIAATDCPSTVLFSHASDPVRSAPMGAQVSILREQDLSTLSVDRVLATLTARA